MLRFIAVALPAAREPGKMMSPTFYETDNSKSVGNISGFINNPIIPTFCMTLSKTKQFRSEINSDGSVTHAPELV